MGQGNETTLVETTFKELFEQERLPSGNSFELMPDTVEVALAVAEVNDPFQWKKKAIRVFTVTKKVAGHDVQDAEKGGPAFVQRMLDTDVIFLSLAWTAAINGTKIDVEDGGVPCPTCATRFKDIDFGNLKIWARGKPADTGIYHVPDIDAGDLPKSLAHGQLCVRDATWMAARRGVSDQSWENPEAVKMHRTMASLMLDREGKGARDVSFSEAKQMRARALVKAARVMDQHIPHFEMQLEIRCAKCKEAAIIPFTQGLG